MNPAEARRRFASAAVARLATADTHNRPHLVPIAFALVGDSVYSAVDAKPKRTMALRRLANVAVNPRVAVLVDHYDEDWSALWWVRADGRARVVDAAEPEAREAIAHLVARYEQYCAAPPTGPRRGYRRRALVGLVGCDRVAPSSRPSLEGSRSIHARRRGDVLDAWRSLKPTRQVPVPIREQG